MTLRALALSLALASAFVVAAPASAQTFLRAAVGVGHNTEFDRAGFNGELGVGQRFELSDPVLALRVGAFARGLWSFERGGAYVDFYDFVARGQLDYRLPGLSSPELTASLFTELGATHYVSYVNLPFIGSTTNSDTGFNFGFGVELAAALTDSVSGFITPFAINFVHIDAERRFRFNLGFRLGVSF